MNDKTLQVLFKLETIAKYYDSNQDTYRARAFKKVIMEIRRRRINLTTIEPFTIEGCGPSIADEIESLLQTGTSERLKAIEYELIDLSDLQRLPGVGPVKAREIFKTYSATTLKELKEQIEKGLVNDQDLINKVNKIDLTVEYISYELALEAGNKMIEILRPYVILVSFAGSLRRKKLLVRDIDILVVPKIGVDLYSIIQREGYKVEYGGEQKIRVEYLIGEIFKGGDIVITTEKEWPFAINYLTGSKEFNIGIRARLKKMGYTINEHRLLNLETNEEVPLKTEEDLFKFLGIKFIKPEDRKAFSNAWRLY